MSIIKSDIKKELDKIIENTVTKLLFIKVDDSDEWNFICDYVVNGLIENKQDYSLSKDDPF